MYFGALFSLFFWLFWPQISLSIRKCGKKGFGRHRIRTRESYESHHHTTSYTPYPHTISEPPHTASLWFDAPFSPPQFSYLCISMFLCNPNFNFGQAFHYVYHSTPDRNRPLAVLFHVYCYVYEFTLGTINGHFNSIRYTCLKHNAQIKNDAYVACKIIHQKFPSPIMLHIWVCFTPDTWH